MIDPSLGYRVDHAGRSVVISAATKKNQNVIDAAKGADLLVHSIGAARPELIAAAPIWGRIMAHHITPEKAGEVFNEAKPRLAVFTHVVALTNGKIKPVGAKEIMECTRAIYSGPLKMGSDLMSISVTAEEVTAKPHGG